MRYRILKRLFNRPANPPSGPPLLSRLATAHSRLPSRLPAPGTAVMLRFTWLSVTTRPNRFRFRGPSTRFRIWQEAVEVNRLTGTLTAWVTVWTTPVRVSVRVAVTVPMALRVPPWFAKLVTLRTALEIVLVPT